MAVVTLAADGSIQIPETLRQKLHLRDGDRLRVETDRAGHLVVRPVREPDLGRIPGLLRHRALQGPVSVEDMNAAVLDEAASRLNASKLE